MAGRGPAPKDPSTRQRRNAKSTKTSLERPTLRSVADLDDLTVAQLRDMLAELNLSRPADQQLDTRGRKAQLAERIIAAESPVPSMPQHPPMVTEDGVELAVEWHTQTVAWWNDVWTSPMVSAWDESDVHNVTVVALLYNDIWLATTARERKDALAEYRQQRADLGLSPLARSRLQWSIEVADDAVAKGTKRRQTAGQSGSSGPRPAGVDPRHTLTSVS